MLEWKTITEDQKIMTKYTYEEHKCPYCEHQFVVEMRGSTYALKGSASKHILTKCPKCENELYIASGYKYGCLAELIPAEDVRIVSLCL